MCELSFQSLLTVEEVFQESATEAKLSHMAEGKMKTEVVPRLMKDMAYNYMDEDV